MQRRLNITLPGETVELMDRFAQRGNRSRLIDQAVRSYIQAVGREELRRRLRAGYRRGAKRDRELAAAWFLVDEEAWTRKPQ